MPLQRYLNVSQLRELMIGMEYDLGLGHLSQNEKDVFYAVISVIDANRGRDGVAKSEEIKAHILVADMTQPTFHRSLKTLIDLGLINRAPNTKAGSYTNPNKEMNALA